MEQEQVIDKIRKLLAQAAGTPFSEESNAARAMADKLMMKYTIDQATLDAGRPREERERPAQQMVTVCEGDSPIKEGLMRLISAIAPHCRCRLLHYAYASRDYDYQVQLFGFQADIEYCEMLFSNLMLHLTGDIAPKYDENKSFEENLALFKEAGMKWKDMHVLLRPHMPYEDHEFTRKIGVRYTGIYTKFCERTGRNRQYTDPTVYVRSFVNGFAQEVEQRLYDMKVEQDKFVRSSAPGTSLMLVDRKKEVDDLYDSVPKSSKHVRTSAKKVDRRAYNSGARSANQADLGPGEPKSRRRVLDD